MRSKVVYDPLAMMEQKTIGMVELDLIKSCWKADGHENTEAGLRGEGLSKDNRHKPLLIHFNSELMRVKCKFMVILQELVFMVKELLLFGGAKFEEFSSEEEGDNTVMRDLSNRLGRIILIVLRIVSKHTSNEHFKFKLNSALRVAAEKGNNIVLNFEGNATSREDQMPLELQWETTFVDIVDDFKEILEDFRKGRGEGVADDGRVSPISNVLKSGRRRSSVERVQRFFGFAKGA